MSGREYAPVRMLVPQPMMVQYAIGQTTASIHAQGQGQGQVQQLWVGGMLTPSAVAPLAFAPALPLGPPHTSVGVGHTTAVSAGGAHAVSEGPAGKRRRVPC